LNLRIYALIALMFVMYLLPWVANPAASLTMNGYELAEWTSLHPTAQNANQPLLTSLLLRLPLVCIALLAAFMSLIDQWTSRIIPALIVLVVAAGLLPPELIQATDNPNSRQQGILALVTLVGGAIGLSGIFRRHRRWIAAGIAGIGAAASLIGLAQGLDMMRSFAVPTEVGIGGIGLAATFVIAVLGLVTNQTGQH
jgi:hypothetical protein